MKGREDFLRVKKEKDFGILEKEIVYVLVFLMDYGQGLLQRDRDKIEERILVFGGKWRVVKLVVV